MLDTLQRENSVRNAGHAPLWKRLDAFPADPLAFCAALAAPKVAGRMATEGGWGFVLDSGAASAQGRYLYASAAPPVQTLELTEDSYVLGPGRRGRQFFEGPPFELLRELLGPPCPTGEPIPPFWGGAVGYISYDFAPKLEPALRGWPARPDPVGVPQMALGFYDEIVALDLAERKTYAIVSTPSPDGSARLRRLEDRLRRALPAPGPGKPARAPRGPRLRMSPDERGFKDMVERAKSAIDRGDIYQANLSLRFSGPFAGDLWRVQRALREANPSPYACHLWFPRFSILSTSPELLVSVRGNQVATRPIAGTRPRGASAPEDKRLEGSLLLSPKERAEHIMLVDLERNDLGRVSATGSVRVSERMAVERYSHVMHIVSQVEGRLAAGVSPFEAVRAVFPGGTISGCPKIRAARIIRELEPLARGPFFGAAGWFGWSGDLDLNILIRTMVFKDGQVHLQAGAGIVADSDPAFEYRESLQKARVLLEALGVSSRPPTRSTRLTA